MTHIYSLEERIKYYISVYQAETQDPAKLAFRTLCHFVDVGQHPWTKEFGEFWKEAGFYWVVIKVNISVYQHVKWYLRKGYEFPLSMNPNYIAKEIIGAIEEVVQILNEKFPKLQFKDEDRFKERKTE